MLDGTEEKEELGEDEEEERERRTEEDRAGREVRQQQAAGMLHRPVLCVTSPPRSVGDTGSN